MHDSSNIMTKSSQGKRHRAQTQQMTGGSRRNQSISESGDGQIVGQILINRAQPSIYFKKQLNQNFRQIIRGE